MQELVMQELKQKTLQDLMKKIKATMKKMTPDM